MPLALLYLIVMLAVILLCFVVFKRPVYEAVLLSFIVLLFATKSWSKLPLYLKDGMNSTLLYSMVAFVAMSQLLTKTGILDSCISVILSLLGRITGGAGYVSVIASSFMGAFSGSGPGNVMAVGTITIPAMKKSGFPPHLAANIQSSSSCLGNMIPPSANIIGAMGAYAALYPDTEITTGKFWLIMWCISIYFIIQRLVTVYAFCKYYKVEPMKKEELPDLKETLKKGWKGLLLPAVILLPFILDAILNKPVFAAQLGTKGAKYLSSSVLLFTAGIACIYSLFITENKEVLNPCKLAEIFANGVKGLAPTVGTCIFGYVIGAMFSDLGVSEGLEAFIMHFNFNKFGMALVISLVTCFLGMVIPGSSLTVMFGPVFITALYSVGIDPLLAAAMLPCICGAMGNITPPFALCVYAGMAIAESDFAKTIKNDLWWVALQLGMQILILIGWLPVIGIGA